MIVDSQIHVWAPETAQHPWPPWGRTHDHRPGAPMTAVEAIARMDGAGVDRAVLIPPSFEGDYNATALEAARRHPDRFAVMGRIDLRRPASFDELLMDRPPALRGIRLVFLNGGSDRWLDDGTADWVWPALQERGMPVMVFAPGRNPRLAEVARQHPDLRITVDHLGLGGDTDDATLMTRVAEVLPLAALANVSVKASALPCFTAAPFPFETLIGPVSAVIDAFGPSRVFWGSDLTRLPCPYEHLVAFFRELDFVSDADRDLILGDALLDWLDWRGVPTAGRQPMAQ